MIEEGLSLQTVGFAAESFDPVAVNRFFEVTAGCAEAGLQGGFRRERYRRLQIKDPERKKGEAFPFPENPFDPLSALEFLIFLPGKLPADNL